MSVTMEKGLKKAKKKRKKRILVINKTDKDNTLLYFINIVTLRL